MFFKKILSVMLCLYFILCDAGASSLEAGSLLDGFRLLPEINQNNNEKLNYIFEVEYQDKDCVKFSIYHEDDQVIYQSPECHKIFNRSVKNESPRCGTISIMQYDFKMKDTEQLYERKVLVQQRNGLGAGILSIIFKFFHNSSDNILAMYNLSISKDFYKEAQQEGNLTKYGGIISSVEYKWFGLLPKK